MTLNVHAQLKAHAPVHGLSMALSELATVLLTCLCPSSQRPGLLVPEAFDLESNYSTPYFIE
jgi:hypothetical protein